MNGCLRLFGLARRAGALVSGEDNIRSAVYDHKAKAVFITADAMTNSRKKAVRLAEYGKIPCVEIPCGKEELGAAAGARELAAVALTNLEMACGIMKKLAESDPEKYGAAASTLESRAKARREREKGTPRRNVVKRKENA